MHLKSVPDFSLRGARLAEQRAELWAWVQAFLRGPGGNVALAEGLSDRRLILEGPRWFPLDGLTPICGPGKYPYPESEECWERRVQEMCDSLRRGWQPPPLLVFDYARRGRLEIVDGNHRQEGLRRGGATHGWVIFVFRSAEERQRLLERAAEEEARRGG